MNKDPAKIWERVGEEACRAGLKPVPTSQPFTLSWFLFSSGKAQGYFSLQILRNSFEGGPFLDGAGVVPAGLQGLGLFPAELLDSRGHFLPEEQLLEDMPFRRGKIHLQVKNFTFFGGIKHGWILRCYGIKGNGIPVYFYTVFSFQFSVKRLIMINKGMIKVVVT